MYPTGVLLQSGTHYGPHHGPMGPAGGTAFGFLWGPVWLLITVLVVVGGAYLALQFLQQRADAGTDDALAVLERRYARGEIDSEEFEKRRTRLRQRQNS